MGTLLQEFGHDIVLLYFIEKVLKEKADALFYLVSPATGPRLDIHFWNPDKNEYTSAYNISGNNYIPEFSLRYNIEEALIEKINRSSSYQNLEWYKEISQSINRDPKNFIMEIYNGVQQNDIAMPDIIGFNRKGKEIVWAELKFEGLSSNAQKSVENQFLVAKNRSIPFYLVVPKNPVYGREITNSWLRNNLPNEVQIYKFSSNSRTVIPKRDEIAFIQVSKQN